MQDIPVPDKSPELELAITASVKAGRAVMEIYGREFKTATKDDDSPVTEADLESNHIIKQILSQTPYRILSEEDTDDVRRLSEDTIWIVDPLDGTADFIDKTGEFTVMIALVRNQRPVLGVINCPAQKTIFAAQYGTGAFRHHDGGWQHISVTGISEIAKCRKVGSLHHPTEAEERLVRRLGITKSASVGSSLKVGKISSGEAEVYIAATDRMKEWDTAASYCIIHEAGGRMTDLLGNDITYNNRLVNHQDGILVTNGLVHDVIVEEFAKL